MPAAGDGSWSYEVADSCNANSVNRGTITFSQVNTDASTTLSILLFLEGDQLGSYSFPMGTVDGTIAFDDLANGVYTWEVTPNPGTLVEGGVTIACVETPPDPEPDPEIPGTATPPSAKYMAVGGTLSNPIEYTFAFQVNDALGVVKTGHYLKVNIYRQGELTPFASTRQRVKNGVAVVDVARFVKALVSSQAAFDDSLTISTDTNAIAGFTIGFVEYFGTTVMDEVKEDTVKYAVNAALQSLDGNYVQHVITAVAS